MALTKFEIVGMLYQQMGIPKIECMAIVERFFDIIKAELEKGNPVKVSGFGKWTVKSKRARNGRNPQSGEAIIIDAKKVITFKPSHVLKDIITSSK